MKPTKEQLADPKWWDKQAHKKYKYCYWNEAVGCLYFEKRYDHLFVPLAKRPEAKWKPEVGEGCEFLWGNNWEVCNILAINTCKLGRLQFIIRDHTTNAAILYEEDGVDFRPIKTQREKFVERVVYETLNMCSEQLRERIANELYDAGCRFGLTEKDGE